MEEKLIGFGGGKGGGGSPDVTEVSGTSEAYVEVLLGLGEGRIEGLIGGAKGIYLDDTPIENPDGTRNFSDFTYVFADGSQSQLHIPAAAGEIASESSVGVEVLHGFPVTRQIINPDIDGIRVRIGIQLQDVDSDDGDVKAEPLNFAIAIKEGNGAFVERLAYRNDTFVGRYPTLTEFTYFFPVNSNVTDIFQVRVEKISQDNDAQREETRILRWQAYAEVILERLEYPNTALIWMQFPGNAFKSVPSRMYDVGGTKFLIPTVFSVNPGDRGLDHSGSAWSGGFYEPSQAPADAAWVVWNLLTNTRYGLGQKIAGYLGLGRGLLESDVDKFALYQCSLHNNGMVADGFGAIERRYSANGLIQGNQDAWEVIQSVCSNFATKAYWNGSQISFWQDRPWVGGPAAIITNADVEEGRFVYTSQEWKGITTVCRVTWNDPIQDYAATPELVEYPLGIQEWGIHEDEFSTMLCTSRGQAYRAGLRLILSSLLDNEMVSFKCRPFAFYRKPGDVICIQDNRRSRSRLGGLIKSATISAIVPDSPVTLTGAPPFRIRITLPNLIVEERDLINGVGTHVVLYPTVPFTYAPLTHSNWMVKDGAGSDRLYRILSISPGQSGNQLIYEISCKKYTG